MFLNVNVKVKLVEGGRREGAGDLWEIADRR